MFHLTAECSNVFVSIFRCYDRSRILAVTCNAEGEMFGVFTFNSTNFIAKILFFLEGIEGVQKSK